MKRRTPESRLLIFEPTLVAALIELAAGLLLVALMPTAGQSLPWHQDAAQGISEREAVAFQRKVTELSSPSSSSHRALKPIVLTDAEINSYLKYDHPQFLPPAVSNLVIHLKPEGVYGAADVNFDRLQAAQPSATDLGTRLVASIFKGTQHVTALAKIASSKGTGKLTIQDVHVGSLALSDWLVNWLIQTYVESEYKIDLNKPFPLPADVTRIDFAPGKAIFVRNRN